MKALLAKLFKRPAAPTPAPEPAAAPAKPHTQRKYHNKRRRHAPKGARRIDPNGPIIQQARGRK